MGASVAGPGEHFREGCSGVRCLDLELRSRGCGAEWLLESLR
jgi:hypothetical protein